MKTKSKTTAYIIHSIAATALLLTGQISLASSATWLLSPQDSAWENGNNWTTGGPPNGPSDVATFAQSSQTDVDVSTSVEVNSIVFTSDSDSFTLNISPYGASGGELIISGTGVTNNNTVLQTFIARNGGQIVFNNASTAASAHMSILSGGRANPSEDSTGYTIFNDTSSAAAASIKNFSRELGFFGDIGRTIFNGASTADHASISNYGAGNSHGVGGQTIFNDTSTAANASIDNWTSGEVSTADASLTTFNGASTAGHATITNHGADFSFTVSGMTIFSGSSTADSAILIANGGVVGGSYGGSISFIGASTGGTARIEVFDNGYLDISGRQPGVTIGSIEGSGNVFLGANNLRVGTNNISTSFSGVVSGSGTLTKIGGGVLTLQANDCIADTVGLILVSGSIINLDFTGPPDVIASLVVDGVPQPPGVYGGPMSGAPNILPEFGGSGTVSVGVDQRRRYDFNGDGQPDYVLYNASTHQTAIWYLHNNLYLSGRYGPTLPANWLLVDVADFSRDSHPDYVLRNPITRQTAIWYLNNNVYVVGVYGPTPPSGWELVATADFNGDGNPDYVLYNAATRQTAIWYLNNNVYVSGAYGPTLPVGWSLVGLADFNGDGKTDYLLFNLTTRQSAIWYLNNNVYVSGVYGPTLPSGWQLKGATDYSGDGHPDYALFNVTTGRSAIWYLNNNVYLGGTYGPTVPTGWSLSAP